MKKLFYKLVLNLGLREVMTNNFLRLLFIDMEYLKLCVLVFNCAYLVEVRAAEPVGDQVVGDPERRFFQFMRGFRVRPGKNFHN